MLVRRDIMRDSLTLSIEGMHCGGCVRRVTTALEGVKGVELGPVEVGSAQMTFDPNRVSIEEIAAAVDRIGFSARVEKS
jgi:copper chaperone CopZ